MLGLARSLRVSLLGCLATVALAVPGLSADCVKSAKGPISELEFTAVITVENISQQFSSVQALVAESGGCIGTSALVIRPAGGDDVFEFQSCGTSHLIYPTTSWQVVGAGLCSYLVYYPL